VAVDDAGRAIVVGNTRSGDLPLANPTHAILTGLHCLHHPPFRANHKLVPVTLAYNEPTSSATHRTRAI
jgi:hypothetical protein